MKNGTLVEACVLYRANLDGVFEIVPNSNDFTATIKDVSYTVSGISTPSAQYPNLSQSQDVGEYLSVNVANGAITVHTKAVPSTNETYQLEAIVRVGGMEIHKYMNILLIDDNTPILYASQSDLFSVISTKYGTDYSVQQAYFDFYKSHLLSLTGTVDFSSHTQISSMLTDTSESIFKYLHNITGITMDGCT